MEKTNLTVKNNVYVSVYKETTTLKSTQVKKKRRNKSDLGPDFVAPDGGWAWVVCIAAGFSNFSIFPGLQQYGLIYRQRMNALQFDAKQTTTIVNVVMSLSSIVGIVNGAMFRRFTFRQVAIVGGFLCFIGVFTSAFCTTFLQYIVCFSCIYGIGLGLCMAATSLAVNTYFKKKRRKATGFTWTITGLGPIIFPHISIFLLSYYGAQGSILIYSGIALNSVLCAITLQPVLWHVAKPKPPLQSDKDTNVDEGEGDVHITLTASQEQLDECKYCRYQRQSKRGIFSSQYLFNNDDPDKPGYEITEPGTPMLARANDGWFGSRQSIDDLEHSAGVKHRHKLVSRQPSLKSTVLPEEIAEELESDAIGDREALSQPNYFNREREDVERYTSKLSLHNKSGSKAFGCTCAGKRTLMEQNQIDQAKQKAILDAIESDEIAKSKMTFRQKVVKFFDLDLIKDFTFVNLALGMTVMMFGEMNFSVLTPFILASYGYTNNQISLAMSLLGGMDILVRFLAPFALEKVKLGNRVLFAFGIIAITIGRYVLTLYKSYELMLAVFLLIGFGKGFRTIFSPLIIPSYVPLNRLPAASGMQLMFNTIFSLIFGPILGIITDATSYTITIHFINALSICALLLWAGESWIRRILTKRNNKHNEQNTLE